MAVDSHKPPTQQRLAHEMPHAEHSVLKDRWVAYCSNRSHEEAGSKADVEQVIGPTETLADPE